MVIRIISLYGDTACVHLVEQQQQQQLSRQRKRQRQHQQQQLSRQQLKFTRPSALDRQRDSHSTPFDQVYFHHPPPYAAS
jgi:hemolysin activation/secretion protein